MRKSFALSMRYRYTIKHKMVNQHQLFFDCWMKRGKAPELCNFQFDVLVMTFYANERSWKVKESTLCSLSYRPEKYGRL